MSAKTSLHVVFRDADARSAILDVVIDVMQSVWGYIAESMVHNYSTYETQIAGYDPKVLSIPLGRSELLFLYPRQHQMGSISCAVENRSMVISLSLAMALRPNDDFRDISATLWGRLVDFKPVIGLGGEELEVDGDQWVDVQDVGSALPALKADPLYQVAIVSDLPGSFSGAARPIKGGYLVDVASLL